MTDRYHTKIIQVEALQLIDGKHPGEGTAQEMAHWTEGKASWEYDAQLDTLVSTVTFGSYTVTAPDWVLKRPNGQWMVLSDRDFRNAYNVSALIPVETCPICLADMNNTQFSDEAKKCPNCSSGYIGRGRQAEYEILLAAGAVKMHG